MRLAFIIYKYFPFGGLQRDFRRLVEELSGRGHDCRVYCMAWEGEPIAGVDLRRMRVRTGSNHGRNQRFWRRVQDDLAQHPVDGVIGFNKMPGLDVYFAGDPCFAQRAEEQRGWLYRRGARYRHYAAAERAVFDADSATRILLLTEGARESFTHYYNTPTERMYLLPPGVASERRAPENAPRRRRALRAHLGLEPQEYLLLFVGSGFITKGLDRAITALAHMRAEQPGVSARLLVVGQDKSRSFRHLARRLGVADTVEFLGGRDDVADFMLAADMLVHPAVSEAAGIVLLEALASGLPVVVTDVCGYAGHVAAARAGIVLASPFEQQALDRAVMRGIDGVFRADCRESALLYAAHTDLYSLHSQAADLVEQLLGNDHGGVRG